MASPSDQNSETQTFSRSEINLKTSELNKEIDNCTILHQSILSEFSSQKDLSYNVLEGYKNQLLLAKNNLVETHNTWRTMRGNLEPDLKIRNAMDRIEADSEMLISQVSEHMNKLSAKPKTTNPVYTNEIRPTSPKSVYRSAGSKTVSSRYSSRASSQLRMMQVQSQAKAAALKKRLESAKITHELQQQAMQLSNAIEQQKIQAEIDATQAEEQVIAQAIEEEEENGSVISLLSQSQPIITSNPAEPTIYSSPPPSQSSPPPCTLPPTSANHHAVTPVTQTLTSYTPVSKATHPPHELCQPAVRFTTPSSQAPYAYQSPSIPSSVHQQPTFTPEDYAEAINLVRQRPSEPPMFFGDPLEYQDWKVAFHEAFNLSKSSAGQKWLKLRQFVDGKAYKSIQGLYRQKTETSYAAAWAKLDNRYGKGEKVTEAYLEKLQNWPKIKMGDGEALEDFIDLLESIEGLDADINLDTKSANKKLIIKIPHQIGEMWADESTRLERDNGKFPPLKTFIKFLSHHCDIAQNSLSKALEGAKIQTKTRTLDNITRKPANIRTFATRQTESQKFEPHQHACLYCKMDNHKTAVCGKLNSLPFAEAHDFIKGKRLCYACLNGFHNAKECESPSTCNTCKEKHPTALHKMHRTPRNHSQTSDSSKQSKSNPDPENFETQSIQGTLSDQ